MLWTIVPTQLKVGHIAKAEVTVVGILSWAVLGLVAGLLAKLILPGRDPGGLIVTILIGVVGGLLGGYIGTQLGYGSVTGFDLRSLGLAVGGAVILLLAYRMVNR